VDPSYCKDLPELTAGRLDHGASRRRGRRGGLRWHRAAGRRGFSRRRLVDRLRGRAVATTAAEQRCVQCLGPDVTVLTDPPVRRPRVAWRVMDFLADAHDRGVLRRVGSAYQFRHVRIKESLAGQASKS
jgi:hypothetical protein